MPKRTVVMLQGRVPRLPLSTRGFAPMQCSRQTPATGQKFLAMPNKCGAPECSKSLCHILSNMHASSGPHHGGNLLWLHKAKRRSIFILGLHFLIAPSKPSEKHFDHIMENYYAGFSPSQEAMPFWMGTLIAPSQISKEHFGHNMGKSHSGFML